MTKILVVEDADPLRNDIVEMLSFEGFEVIGAENGLVGVDKAREHKPDLIICDIMMPGLDGYGVLNALRNDEQMVATPFIFLTAKTDRTDIRHGMGLGADDYLTKPFVASELLETIHARLQKKATYADLIDNKMQELSNSVITALPHELRTPLNTIIGFSDMLIAEAENLASDQVVEWSTHINLAAQRLYRLVENYLLYIQAEITLRNPKEMAEIRQQWIEHPESVIQFYAVHKAQQAGRENDININIGVSMPINISEQYLGKIVEELVDNALKFSDQGTHVSVETTEHDGKFVLIVTDQGRGMSPEQIRSIGAYMQFDRWFYEQQGSGFGLAVVKRLADLYNARLSIESAPHTGTTVTFKFEAA